MTKKIDVSRVLVAAFLLILILLGLIACTQTASTIDTSAAQDIASSLTYTYDARTAQCFAVVASRHVVEATQNGFTITWVPCSAAVVARIKR